MARTWMALGAALLCLACGGSSSGNNGGGGGGGTGGNGGGSGGSGGGSGGGGGNSGQETVVYSFGPSSGTDGEHPYGGVMLASDGFLYGTTHAGGPQGTGTVFKLSTSGTESILYSFAANGGPGGDARFPVGGVVMDGSGNLWGTATYGGDDNHGNGTVFEISASGTESLHSLVTAGGSGGQPCSTLVVDSAGNLYGTTNGGGAHGAGTVFEISGGVTTILYSFNAAAPTNGPYAGLLSDGAGTFYGTSENTGSGAIGGEVFKSRRRASSPASTRSCRGPTGSMDSACSPGMAPGTSTERPRRVAPTTTQGCRARARYSKISPSGVKTILYSFGQATNDGANPNGSVIFDSAGNLYGATQSGGTYGQGTLFEISSAGVKSTLYSFGASSTDGQNPTGALVWDGAGNLFGTTRTEARTERARCSSTIKATAVAGSSEPPAAVPCPRLRRATASLCPASCAASPGMV